uniref:Uncharacterized protein n=1 Tax=Romanomermis culicivorax TaxID=13658 RepID=A0A915JCB9_ROMCU
MSQIFPASWKIYRFPYDDHGRRYFDCGDVRIWDGKTSHQEHMFLMEMTLCTIKKAAYYQMTARLTMMQHVALGRQVQSFDGLKRFG